MTSGSVVIPSLRNMHVDRVVKGSLRKCLNVVDLTGGKPQNGQQNEHKADSAPLNNWGIGIPVVNAILLLRTIDADVTLVFGNFPIGFVFMMV